MLKHGSEIIAKSRQQWTNYGKQNKKEFIFYRGQCFDMGQFKSAHPGGSQVIKNFIFQDISESLYSVFPHNKLRTELILSKYSVGKIVQSGRQKIRQEEMTPKSRRNSRQDSSMKRSFHFSSPIQKSTSDKEKALQEQSSGKRKGGMRKSLELQSLNLLKLKAKQSQFTEKQKLSIPCPSQNHINSTTSIMAGVRHESTSPESIKERSQNYGTETLECEVSPQIDEDFCQGVNMCGIRVPVMSVRFDRVW